MDNEFYTLLTDKGMAKIASALADKKQIHLQKMAVGDGSGKYYEPTSSQTQLRHEVWRGEMNTLTVAADNPNWLIAEVVLPEDIGGWYVREVGVFDADGELIAIGKFPESYKPLLPGGCGKQVCIRLIMEVSNTTAVTLTVDPSIVLATRDYVDSLMDEHEHSTNHPDATLTQKGFTQLSNATDSDDETKAATPKAVKAAMAEARNHTHTWNQITGVPDGTLTQKGIVKLNNATNSTSTTEAATPSAVKAAMDKANAAAPVNHTHTADQISGIFPKINGDGAFSHVKIVIEFNNDSGIQVFKPILMSEILPGSRCVSTAMMTTQNKGSTTDNYMLTGSSILPGCWRLCLDVTEPPFMGYYQNPTVQIMAQRIPIGSIDKFSNIRKPSIKTNNSIIIPIPSDIKYINLTCDIEGVGNDIVFTASADDPEEYGKQLYSNFLAGMYNS